MSEELNELSKQKAGAGRMATNEPATSRRVANTQKRLLSAVFAIALLLGFAFIFLYFQTGAWQFLGESVFLLASSIVLLRAMLVFRSNYIAAAGNGLFLAVFVIFIPGLLLFSEATIPLTVSGLLLILGLGILFKPAKPGTWMLIALAFGAAGLLVDFVQPLPRFNANEAAFLRLGLPLITATIFIFVLRQAALFFQRGTIQGRMVIAFLLVTILPLALLSYLNNRAIQGTLTRDAQQGVLNAASETANNLDNFNQATLDTVRAEAQIPVFINYLSLLPSQRSGSPELATARATLSALQRRDPFRIFSYALLDNSGINVLDTLAPNIGDDESQTAYFQVAFGENTSHVSEVEYSVQEGVFHAIYFSAPVVNVRGETLGVLRVRYTASVLQDIVRESNDLAGPQSFGVLFEELEGNYVHLAHGSAPETIYTAIVPFNEVVLNELREARRLPQATMFGESALNLPDLHQALTNIDAQQFFSATDIATGTRVNQVAATRLDTQPNGILAFFQPEDVFLASAQQQANISLLLVILVSLAVAAIAVLVARIFSSPIEELTSIAEQVAGGNLSARAPEEGQDEVGILARTFNTMTERLNSVIGNLEATVAERTAHLEQRARYLEAAAEVGQTATKFRTLDEFLPPITNQISEQFGFYHVGIFLIDAQREYAELRAANSEGGWRMLGRGHRLKVGEQGIVGYVTGTGNPRIEQQVGEGEVYYANPDLPATRSEMALPLQVGGQILGALDIQSTEERAFSGEDITVLQVLADQVAVAINNALLLDQLQDSLAAERRAYGELSKDAWKELLSVRVSGGYRSSEKGVSPVSGEWSTLSQKALQENMTIQAKEPVKDGYPLAVPLKIRGDLPIAVLETKKSLADGPWTKEEIALIESVSEQLATALENARLFEQTQRLAQRERIAGDLSSKVWSSPSVDTILQTAVEELGKALNVSQGTIRLNLNTDGDNESSNGDQSSESDREAETGETIHE
jgi:nitrate/nitrite-specific signal transduction histidine kinase